MKVRTFRLSLIFLSVGLIALSVACAAIWLRPQPEAEIPGHSQAAASTPSGWQHLPDGTYFYDDSGNYITGLFPCPQGTYFFDEGGKMVTGWVDFPAGKRHFALDGLMDVGWQQLQGQQYYFRSDGTMAVGWQDTDRGRLHFDKSGQVQTGWISTEEGTWYLREDGTAHTGWYQTDEARYYFLEDGKMATGLVEVAGIQRLFSSDGNYIPLINAQNLLPQDYVLRLVEVENFLVDSTCADALQALMTDARAAGLTCVLNSTYRDVVTQKYLWDYRYNDYLSLGYSPEDSYALTIRRVLYPGASEHHTGLAIDIKGSEELYQWFREHAWEYGFHPRYSGDKEAFTGVRDEPWHLRYMGKELSQILQESGLCFEEYLNTLNA